MSYSTTGITLNKYKETVIYGVFISYDNIRHAKINLSFILIFEALHKVQYAQFVNEFSVAAPSNLITLSVRSGHTKIQPRVIQ